MINQDNSPLWKKALAELTPMNRVHAGPEMADAYEALQKYYPQSERFGYKSGTKAGSWEAPPAWKVINATLTDPDGNEVVNWHRDHVLSIYTYSPSVSTIISRQDLEKHIMSNPEHPDSYPFHFRNQYRFWEPEWGFCIPHNLHKSLKDGDYKVEIETEFYEDQIEMVLHSHEGEHQDALLFVGHFDHPAQCGDGLLGCIAGHEIIRRLEGRQTKLSYKMLSTVEIVGSVFYAENRAKKDHVKEALFSAMSGVDAPLIYAQSFSEQAATDIAMRHVLKFSGEPFTVVPFKQAVGNDEIAYDVVGVDISCGSLMRWPHKYYHTSHDTNDKVNDEAFESYIEIMLSVIDILENNAIITAKFSGLPSLAHPDTDLYLSPPFMSGMKHALISTMLQ